MKILITGGLGHIGSYFLENIHKIKPIKKIYIIDDLSTNRYPSLFSWSKSKIKKNFYKIDLSKKNALKNFKKTDIVINLASLTDAEGSLKIRSKIYSSSINSWKNFEPYMKDFFERLITN